MTQGGQPGSLQGIRVIEIADELAEFTGLTLAGLGAEVIKIEPPGGNATRNIGPFYEDKPGLDRSLYFWQYNRAKKSIVLDLNTEEGLLKLYSLLASADILLQSVSVDHPSPKGLAPQELAVRFPGLIVARMTPFGDSGPWVNYRSSDLIHLALGGVMMNCGYDPEPPGLYDLPPIAPQMWHAYHVAGDQLMIGIVGALLYRESTGQGQYVSCAVHDAVSKNPEQDTMSWVMRRAPIWRQTCRHAMEVRGDVPFISNTKDGRWIMEFMNGTRNKSEDATLREFLRLYGMGVEEEDSEATSSSADTWVPGQKGLDERTARMLERVQRLVRAFTYDRVPWQKAQEVGLMWVPLRKPHENVLDDHWQKRGTFAKVEHPELGRAFWYATSRWVSSAAPWLVGRRAPLLNEDAAALNLTVGLKRTSDRVSLISSEVKPRKVSKRGKHFALESIRILDFGWYLATAGATRFPAGLGAECIKVEWKSHPDSRLGNQAPVGGRVARSRATGPLPPINDPSMGGQFNNKNPGKRGISLNVRHPKGLEIARKLVSLSDVVTEGFSPGVMQKWGLGYEQLKLIRPDIIYVQQSGMGSQGVYGRFRTYGPLAASLSGLSEMSGLPEPAMPAGWGYSYLDWGAAYSMALAILSALYHRARTGNGQWIDASQCEVGIALTGTAILDWSANGREWQRYGNRSPYKAAAPHAAFPCAGEDKWLAIACFSEQDWERLVCVAKQCAWTSDERFSTLAGRIANQDALEAAISEWTSVHDAFVLMHQLQAAGVPAGVCQTAEDRCDVDPQLKALEWLTEVSGMKIGTWPVMEAAYKMSVSPPYVGGTIDRGAPCYGEDNEYVFGELLGMSSHEIRELSEQDVI